MKEDGASSVIPVFLRGDMANKPQAHSAAYLSALFALLTAVLCDDRDASAENLLALTKTQWNGPP
jgi:hypothetical protein